MRTPSDKTGTGMKQAPPLRERKRGADRKVEKCPIRV
nr:MAG TPA: hypothetical protein [Caudoviricetes sp.]